MPNNGISQVVFVMCANKSNMRLHSRGFKKKHQTGKEDERPPNSSC